MFAKNEFQFLNQIFLRFPAINGSEYKIEGLAAIIKSDNFRNALWLAAPDFYKELEKKGFEADALTSKERLTALKFYNRMSFRATPFGAFSVVSLIPWLPTTEAKEPTFGKRLLHLLPAIRWEKMLRTENAENLQYFLAVNPTLYRLGDSWRYARYDEDHLGKLTFYTYGLDVDDANIALLEHLRLKSLKHQQLIEFLMELTGCSVEDASEYIIHLANEQVIISSQETTLLINHETRLTDALIRTLVYEEGLKLEQAIRQTTTRIPEKLTGKHLYVGLEQICSDGGLDHGWQKQICDALEVLSVLTPDSQAGPLQDFREAFQRKFGGRIVPLLEALDPDIGLDYDGLRQADEHELLRGLDFYREQRRSASLSWTPIHQLIMKLWLQNPDRTEYAPVFLFSNDLKELSAGELRLPPSLTVFFSIVADQLILHTAGGITATALTGRFTAFSDDFHQLCRTTVDWEKQINPDVVFAELVQISHANIDNVNRRRRIYDQSIPLNSFPEKGDLLPINLGLLALGEELILIDLISGKRVIPRLPTAFNYYNNDMPLFRFLCDLQSQSLKRNLQLDLTKLFPGLDFYPRIVFEKVILSLACWKLSKTEISELTQRPLSIPRLRLFCKKRGIPRLIAAGHGDQQLIFDLINDDEALFFLESLLDEANNVITEQLQVGDEALRQYLATIVNKQPVYQGFNYKQSSNTTVTRDFKPGSEWLYLKVYCTPRSAQQLLLNVIMPWIKSNSDFITSWFFVRFYDPESHLRFRVQVPSSNVDRLQADLQSILWASEFQHLIKRMHLDTYERELERYTPDLIERVESIFHLGSEVVMEYFSTKTEDVEPIYLIWPIKHCYYLLVDYFNSNDDEIASLCDRMANLFFQEHGGQKKLKLSMDRSYRELRPVLNKMQKKSMSFPAESSLSVEIRQLSFASAQLNDSIRHSLIADIIHMQVNRVFISDQRKNETFIWHCLSKFSHSKIALQAINSRQEYVRNVVNNNY